MLKEQVGMSCTFHGKRLFHHTFNSAHFVDLLQRTHVNTSVSSKRDLLWLAVRKNSP